MLGDFFPFFTAAAFSGCGFPHQLAIAIRSSCLNLTKLDFSKKTSLFELDRPGFIEDSMSDAQPPRPSD
jgi:hypothetical protein